MKKKKKKENKFQQELVAEIEARMPECLVLKNDPNYIQGIPDLTILCPLDWATLEVKRHVDEAEDFRPNQEYYIDKMNEMSYSKVIYPENKEEILDEIQQTFAARRNARILKR